MRLLGAGRWHHPIRDRPAACFIAVRGRTGVGKSTIAANLAVALAGLRSRVVLIDLDLRHPTQHQLFGIATPVHGLKALLREQIDTLEQALTPTPVRNLHLVSGDGAVLPNGAAAVEQQRRLLAQIWELDADVVVADVGSDSGGELVDLFEMGAIRVVVSAPDSRSIRRGYNFFKEQVVREIEHVAGGTSEGALLVGALKSPHARPMNELLARLGGKPNLHAATLQALQGFTGRLIGNRIRNHAEADLMHAASRLLADYLGINVPVLGTLETSLQIDATRISGKPLLLGAGIDRNVRLFHSMAAQLLTEGEESEAPRCVTRSVAPSLTPSLSPAPTGAGATVRAPVVPDADGADLPSSLGGYMRRHPRHPVDWHAQFRSDSGKETPVRVFEVSQSGASIETLPGLDNGDQGLLIFWQVAQQPQVRVTVKDARRPLGRAGLEFIDTGSEEVGARLVELAAHERSNM
ncbi:MAG: P-loop NTPase [Polyangia bacterium]